jgi:diguanylate cyclase (GGDEF)-like protein/PAS domain S-box-containing protein
VADRPTAVALAAGVALALLQLVSVDGPFGLVCYSGAGAVGVAMAVGGLRRHRPARPAPWWWITGGLAAVVLADTTWSALSLAGHEPEGVSLVDALYLLSYPLLTIGAFQLARARGARLRSEAVVDALVLVLPAGVAAWVWLVRPALGDDLAPLELGLGIAYPLLDIIVVAAAAWLGFSGRRTASQRLLLGGLLATFVADVLYAGVQSGGTDLPVDDVAWALGFVLLGAAVSHPSMASMQEPDPDVLASQLSHRRFVLLGAAPAIIPVLHLVNSAGEATEVVVGATSTVVVGLVVARLARLLREVDAARRAVVGAERRFRALVQDSAELVAVIDRNGVVTYVSPAVQAVLGYTPDEVVGASGMRFIHPEDLPRVQSVLLDLARRPGDTVTLQYRCTVVGGGHRWLEATATNLLADPDVAGIVLNERDVTSDRAAVEALRTRAQQQETVARLGQLALDGSATEHLLDEAVQLVRSTMDVASCQLFRRTDDRRLTLEAACGPTEGMAGRFRIEIGRRSQSGYTLAMRHPVVSTDLSAETRFDAPPLGAVVARSAASVVVDGREHPYGVLIVHSLEARVFTAEDVAFLQSIANSLALVLERRATEAHVRWRATHDGLTGLPNRAHLLEHLDAALLRDDDGQVAVLFCDIDHFKVVNDGLGHDAGDRLLVTVAERLRAAAEPDDVVARFGGDEFVVLRDRVASADDADELARRLLAAIAAPVRLGSERLHLDASIGIAVGRRGRATASTLLRDADAAMYRAKELGRGRAEHFDDDLRDRLMHRLHTATALRGAPESDQLRLHFQPVVALATGRIVAVEALLRWRQADGTLLPPAAFIPLAEETGAIDVLGRWVIEQACMQLAWWDRGGVQLEMSVNVAPRQLLGGDLPTVVRAACADAGVSPDRLTLELTEHALLQDTDAAVHAVRQLADLGVQLSIDDFGTGWSSLAYLKRLPVTELKVDRSFVADLTADAADAAIVEAMVRLGHTLGLRTVAEGIEAADQAAALSALGCDRGQGYLFCPPLPPEELAVERVVSVGFATR